MATILQRHEPILREKTQGVPPADIGSRKIKKILDDMRAALDEQNDGVAIAAPQIGVPLSIFMVSELMHAQADGMLDSWSKEDIEKRDWGYPVFINPVIVRKSKKRIPMEEGCLSVRYAYGEVQRHDKVTITAFDEKGEKITRGASGLLAQVFQHEIDHLDGVLFIDRARNVREIPPGKQVKCKMALLH